MISLTAQSIHSTSLSVAGARADMLSARSSPSIKDSRGTERTQALREQQKLQELQARDREVRAHEQAHLSAAGGHARGGANYTYERGPDQRLYAVSGEVNVDTSAVANDPVATLRKAQTIRRAALAPANPSAQDRRVAAEATRMEAEARRELSAQDQESQGEPPSTDAPIAHSETTDSSQTSTTQSCPACGGAHASSAHDGLAAYTASGAIATGSQIDRRY